MTKVTSPSYRDGLPPSWNVQNSGMANEGTVGNAPLASIPGTDLSGVLQSASNLSDVPDKKTARTNLGAGFNVFHAVVDYGASTAGSGTANLAALQACITAAGAASGTAYIPSGTYHIATGALVIPSYVKVTGDIMYGTVIEQDSNNKDIIQLNGSSGTPILGAEIRHLTLQGPGKASGSTGVGLNLNYADDTNVFERVYINNCGSHGVLMQNSYIAEFRDCWFYYNGGDGFHGVTSVNVVNFHTCAFDQNALDGLYLSGMAGMNILGCDFESNGNHGAWLVNCYAANVIGNDFENNGTATTNTYDALRIDHTQGYGGPCVTGNNFTGTAGQTANGINCISVTSAFLEANSFNNFANTDINIDSGCTGVTVGKANAHEAGSGVLVTDAGTGTTYYGIYEGPDTAADYGYKEWNLNPFQSALSSSLAGFTAGVPFGARVTVRRVRTITRVWIAWYPGTGTAASNSYFGLYNSSGNRVAVSTDVSATGAGQISVSFGSTVLQPGTYWVAVLVGTQAGTTNAGAAICPNAVSGGFLPATGAGVAVTAAKWVKLGNLTGQASLPGSVTLASNVVSTVPFWCAVS